MEFLVTLGEGLAVLFLSLVVSSPCYLLRNLYEEKGWRFKLIVASIITIWCFVLGSITVVK